MNVHVGQGVCIPVVFLDISEAVKKVISMKLMFGSMETVYSIGICWILMIQKQLQFALKIRKARKD